jgi:hypothetical protein
MQILLVVVDIDRTLWKKQYHHISDETQSPWRLSEKKKETRLILIPHLAHRQTACCADRFIHSTSLGSKLDADKARYHI